MLTRGVYSHTAGKADNRDSNLSPSRSLQIPDCPNWQNKDQHVTDNVGKIGKLVPEQQVKTFAVGDGLIPGIGERHTLELGSDDGGHTVGDEERNHCPAGTPRPFVGEDAQV